MANAFTTQTLQDGESRIVMLFTGTLDTANESATAKVDVSALTPVPAKVRVDKIHYTVSDGLTLQLLWDATADVRFAALSGGGCLDATGFGGFQSNAGDGATGDIMFSTLGWAGVMSYTVVLEMTKR